MIEVEEVSEQTTESTRLGASLATAASPAEDRTRKQEESKPLPEASEADESLGGTNVESLKVSILNVPCTLNIQECNMFKKKRTGLRQNHKRLGIECVTIQTEGTK